MFKVKCAGVTVWMLVMVVSFTAMAYENVSIKNETNSAVWGKVYYAASGVCPTDRYEVKAGVTWESPAPRGICLVKRITVFHKGRDDSDEGGGKVIEGCSWFSEVGSNFALFSVIPWQGPCGNIAVQRRSSGRL